MSNLKVIFASMQAMLVGFLAALPEIILALIVFVIFYFAAKLTRRLIRRVMSQKSPHRNVGLVLGRLAQSLIILLGVLVALMIALPSFKPGQLVETLGIGGVAIGFAFKDILQNFLAGILILLTEPFRIGDQIVVAGFEGLVEKIETRATFLKTYDGRQVVIPNSTLFTQTVTVNTAFPKRRLEYDVGVGYGDDLAMVQRLVLKTLDGLPGVLKEPKPEALVVELAGSSVNVRARWWIEPPRQIDLMASMSESLAALKVALSGAGIDLPFPTHQVLFHDQTDDADGDRTRQREGWPAKKDGNPKSRFAVVSEQKKADREDRENARASHLERVPQQSGGHHEKPAAITPQN